MPDELAESQNNTLVYHSRESENPLFPILTCSWIPTFAGMTTFHDCIMLKLSLFIYKQRTLK